MRPRLLYYDILAPQPDRQASSVRCAQLIELFLERGMAVDFASLAAPEHPGEVALLRSLGAAYLPWCDDEARRAFLVERARDYDIILLAWTMVARRFIEVARRTAPDALIIFDTVDVNHVREYREARAYGNQNTLRRALRTRARETHAMRTADVTFAITEADAATLSALVPEARLAVVTMWREPAAVAGSSPAEPTLLFVGHYQSGHNYDAALGLAQEIFPRVQAHQPNARLVLAGSDPVTQIRSLAGPAIAVPGWLPDLAPVYLSASVFVAPLRFGSGLKGKMLQAMAHGLPIVASAVAAEGIGLRDGIDFLEANSAAASAAAVLRLLGDAALARRLGDSARRLLVERYGRAVVARQLDAALALRPANA
jgi:glycosyltransferase involved in cell wall biosynthesis